MTPRLLGGVAVEVAHQQRPRADEAHVAAEHIPKLRQLVEAQSADHPSDARQALFVGEQCSGGVALVGHRPELGDVEGASAESRTCLSEEHRPADRRGSCDGNDRHDRCRRGSDWQSDGEVEEPLSTALVEGRGHGRYELRAVPMMVACTSSRKGRRGLLAILTARCESNCCLRWRELHGSSSRSAGEDRA